MFDRQASAVHGGCVPAYPANGSTSSVSARVRERVSDFLARPLVRRVGTCLAGVILVLAAGSAARHLLGLAHLLARHQPTPQECLFATIAVVGASYGSALLLVGEHLFDPVEVAPRWCRHA